jgi:hypothetical protein
MSEFSDNLPRKFAKTFGGALYSIYLIIYMRARVTNIYEMQLLLYKNVSIWYNYRPKR